MSKAVPAGYETVTEGKATVLFSKGDSDAFYNEAQIKNRDLSVLVLNEYARQVEAEARDQIAKRKTGQPWRKIPPTWSTWGRQVEDVEETEEHAEKEKEDGVEQDTKDGKKQKKKANFVYKDEGLTGLRILEALSASGLRSVRYIKEITEGVGLDKIVVNDLEQHAFESIQRNAEFNDLAGDKRFQPSLGDAVMLMYKHRMDPDSNKDHTKVKSFLGKLAEFDDEKDTFDVIDLDPYGSPALFIDSAIQAVRDGGLLCVTATDLSTLCGRNSENCFAKYRAMPLKVGNYPHEMALRILLGSIESVANVYHRHIVPLVSVHMDFYVRVFIRVYTNKNEIKRTATKMGLVFQSRGCDTFYIQKLATDKPGSESNPNHLMRPAALEVPTRCPETGAAFAIGGPIWTDPIHNFAFVETLLESFKQPRENGFDASALGAKDLILGRLTAISEELPDVPLFYNLPSMCKTLHCTMPSSKDMECALLNAGYRYSQPHSDPTGIKTDAPPQVMWDILRAFVKKHPVNIKEDNQRKILQVEPSFEVNFAMTKEVMERTRPSNQFGADRVAKWKKNPKPNWGPKARAVGVSNRQTHKRKTRPSDNKNNNQKEDSNKKPKEENE